MSQQRRKRGSKKRKGAGELPRTQEPPGKGTTGADIPDAGKPAITEDQAGAATLQPSLQQPADQNHYAVDRGTLAEKHAAERQERRKETMQYEIEQPINWRVASSNPMESGTRKGIVKEILPNGELIVETDDPNPVTFRVWEHTALVCGALAPGAVQHGYPDPGAQPAAAPITGPDAGAATAKPVALVYKYAPYYQVQEMLALILGPGAKRIGHSIIPAAGPTRTEYIFLSNTEPQKLAAAVVGKYPDLFEAQPTEPTPEAIANAIHTCSTGALPVLDI